MTVLTISQDTLIMLPDGATGGTVQISYNGTTVGPVIASGDDQGRAVLVQGRLAKLTALDGKSPLQIAGREAGGWLPARVTLRIYPTGSATVAPIILSGLPVGSPDAPGIWNLSNIDDASGGMDVITPAERQAIAVLRERAATAADQAEAAAQSASGAEAKAAATIGQLQSSISSAAQAAAAGTVARVDAALADTAQMGAEALALTGIDPAYISETTADPPISPAGMKGARRTPEGGIVRLESDGAAWQTRGESVPGRAEVTAVKTALELSGIADLTAYAGNAQTIVVQDRLRGGVFVRALKSVAGEPDSGERFAHTDSRYVWARRDVGEKLNLLHYGAVPDFNPALPSQGTDNYDALFAIINRERQRGIELPDGDYKIRSGLFALGQTAIEISGKGRLWSADHTKPVLRLGDIELLTLRDITLSHIGVNAVIGNVNPQRNQANVDGQGVQLNGISRGTISGVNVGGMRTYAGAIGGVVGAAWMIADCHNLTFLSCGAYNSLADGFHVSKGSSNLTFIGCYADNNGDDQFPVVSYVDEVAPRRDEQGRVVLKNGAVENIPTRCRNIKFIGCHGSRSYARGFVNAGGEDVSWSDCTSDRTAYAGFKVLTDPGGTYAASQRPGLTKIANCTARGAGTLIPAEGYPHAPNYDTDATAGDNLLYARVGLHSDGTCSRLEINGFISIGGARGGFYLPDFVGAATGLYSQGDGFYPAVVASNYISGVGLDLGTLEARDALGDGWRIQADDSLIGHVISRYAATAGVVLIGNDNTVGLVRSTGSSQRAGSDKSFPNLQVVGDRNRVRGGRIRKGDLPQTPNFAVVNSGAGNRYLEINARDGWGYQPMLDNGTGTVVRDCEGLPSLPAA